MPFREHASQPLGGSAAVKISHSYQNFPLLSMVHVSLLAKSKHVTKY